MGTSLQRVLSRIPVTSHASLDRVYSKFATWLKQNAKSDFVSMGDCANELAKLRPSMVHKVKMLSWLSLVA